MGIHRQSDRLNRTSKVKLGFFIHLTAFVLVNVLLVAINLLTTPDRLWFYWPMAGWGLGVLAHAAATYAITFWGAKSSKTP